MLQMVHDVERVQHVRFVGMLHKLTWLRSGELHLAEYR